MGKVSTKYLNLDKIISDVYNYYIGEFNLHTWSNYDYKDCREWTYKVLNFNDGMFDPRKRDIVKAEEHFDFLIEEEWAKYNYNIPNEKGEVENISGYLGMKGTIDLITKIDDKHYEIIDWKTGKRKNWATGEEKTYEKLIDDPQLRIYHYACHKLYPDVDQVSITIFFINDGGPFTICYSKEDLPKTEEMIKDRFIEISNNTKPTAAKKSFKCRFCSYAKETFANKGVESMIEFRDGQICKPGSTMTMCEQTDMMVDLYGLDGTTSMIKHPHAQIGHYKKPGSTE